MNLIKDKIKSNKLLTLVLLIYISLLIIVPNKGLEAINNSLYYLKEMLIIMPVILVLTSLIEAWVPKKTIENSFGKDSGFKGAVFSFLLGSFSAGPIYAAFPICKMLLKKGASISNVVIILSTWAVIKIPMLANEAKFLGPQFMAKRWVLTTASIFLMGYITSRLVKKEDLPSEDIKKSSYGEPLTINEEYCIGCGICAKLAPEYFKIRNKKAKVIKEEIKQEELDGILSSVEECPVKSIKLIIYSDICS